MEQLRYLLGIVTLALVAIAGWFIFNLLTDDDLSDQFHLRLTFEDVRGLRAGADVRYRGVRVGQVFEVQVTEDGSRALVRLVLSDGVDHLACQNSKFWIVSPRFDGLENGATGLDTLVRDSYVAFLTPNPSGPRLGPNSEVSGNERPFRNPDEAGLDPSRHGDLHMWLHAAESHGLVVGSDIRYRGISTGDVRRIELAEDGTHVVMQLRIQQRYRHTVTNASSFWVARPRLSGALMSGIAVEDLNALLGPYISYHSESERGVPVHDGFRTVANEVRPDIDDEDLQVPPQQAPVFESGDPDSGVRLVEVNYEAVEEDWMSPNDVAKRKSTGILFIDQAGRAVVVTARTACDGSYFMLDTFGDPDIKSETVSVAIPGGIVLRAGRSWIDPGGQDLALLVVEGAPPDLAVTAAENLDFEFDDADSASATLQKFDRTMQTNLGAVTDLDAARGSVAVHQDRAGGILAQVNGSDATPVIVPLSRLPAELRPKQ